MEKENRIKSVGVFLFYFTLLILITFGIRKISIDSIEKDATEKRLRLEKQIAENFSYMEKAGTGVVLGKSNVSSLKINEIAIQFKDSTFFVQNVDKLTFYLLEKGDSIQVKNRKIIKK